LKTYFDLIDQTFYFPTEEFAVNNNELYFHQFRLLDLVEKYGTPLKFTYLPKITESIDRAMEYFHNAFQKLNYQNKYTYCYCTKASHFSFVLEQVLKTGAQIETSSAFDIEIIRKLHEKKRIDQNIYVICNGFKRPLYLEYISDLLNTGYKNCIPVLDNMEELDYYQEQVSVPYDMGIRVAADEEPNFEFYTSRLGVRYSDIIGFYKEKIKPQSKARLKLLHFFINTGIKDSAYYWSELSRFIYTYCELKKICPELSIVDIGGGLPIKYSLQFEFDYQALVDQIVESIQWICNKNNVPVPHIMTEFGNYTVGESGGVIYSILGQKQQNDKELWYMIDGSFITNLPDIWGLNQKFVMLAINNWDANFHKVNLGGLTCDSMDYYNSESHTSEVFLPKINNGSQQYIGLFHTGAYQESLGGYGGIQHCLIPAPKHVLVDKNEQGEIETRLFADEQTSEGMLDILGY